MGALDEKRFEDIVRAGCAACGHRILEIKTYIDKSLVVMAGDPNNEGRWAHDGEKFVDGTFSITCTACSASAFASDMCPRCNADGALAKVQADTSRMHVPKRCPKCNELELLVVALVPATAKYGDGGTPKPKQLADFGDAGYHVIAFACGGGCDHAVVADRCPLCDAAGPLRPRP